MVEPISNRNQAKKFLVRIVNQLTVDNSSFGKKTNSER